MSVEAMYQEIILDHYRERHHHGLREPFDAEVHHVNPSCGDELTLRLTRDGDVIVDVSYEAVGCAISQASVSVMADLVLSKPVAEAMELHDGFQQMIQGQGKVHLDEDIFGDAVAFEGVAQFVGRVKCAMLGWAALRDTILRTSGGKDD